MNTKALKTQGINALLVTAGFAGANAVSKITPIKNDKIKAVLPVVLGTTAALTTKNKNIQLAGAGAAAYGLLKTIRTLLTGSDPMGTNGVTGIADNPAVKKVLDMLIPNLGSADDLDYGSSHNYFEPAIVDVPYEEISGIGSIEESSLLGSINEDDLMGLDYANEMYL